jgi:hypothetical protein
MAKPMKEFNACNCPGAETAASKVPEIVNGQINDAVGVARGRTNGEDIFLEACTSLVKGKCRNRFSIKGSPELDCPFAGK